MEGYASEQEQIEALKRWWKANGKSVILGIALGLAIVGGSKWWMDSKQGQAEAASDQYEQVLQEIQQGEGAAAVERGGRVMQDFASSNYASLTALVLAKYKVGQSDLEGARYYLQWVVDHAANASFKDVARLRLAQVLLAMGETTEALQSVEAADTTIFPGPALELKGDILIAMGRRDEARQAYSAASATESGADVSRIQMKLAEVGGTGKP